MDAAAPVWDRVHPPRLRARARRPGTSAGWPMS